MAFEAVQSAVLVDSKLSKGRQLLAEEVHRFCRNEDNFYPTKVFFTLQELAIYSVPGRSSLIDDYIYSNI